VSDAVYTLSELTRRWKTSRNTILAMIHGGRLAAFRLGLRTYRVAADEVERHERANGMRAT
jgi:excisionase family DNA binding protein